MHKVLVNRLGGLSLPRKSVVRLTDRPDMTLDVYRGRKTTIQQQLGIRNTPQIFEKKTLIIITKIIKLSGQCFLRLFIFLSPSKILNFLCNWGEINTRKV